MGRRDGLLRKTRIVMLKGQPSSRDQLLAGPFRARLN